MREINIVLLKELVKDFTIDKENSYINSYQEFITYFENISEIKEHHLIISSHFVYGWMPTVLNFRMKNLDKVLSLVNKAKTGIILTSSELDIIKNCINNSLVGASKLLHFINPELYPIWDSKIFKYWKGEKSIYGIQFANNYLKYLKEIHSVVEHKEFTEVKNKIEATLEYPISSTRATEILIFQAYSQ